MRTGTGSGMLCTEGHDAPTVAPFFFSAILSVNALLVVLEALSAPPLATDEQGVDGSACGSASIFCKNFRYFQKMCQRFTCRSVMYSKSFAFPFSAR